MRSNFRTSLTAVSTAVRSKVTTKSSHFACPEKFRQQNWRVMNRSLAEYMRSCGQLLLGFQCTVVLTGSPHAQNECVCVCVWGGGGVHPGNMKPVHQCLSCRVSLRVCLPLCLHALTTYQHTSLSVCLSVHVLMSQVCLPVSLSLSCLSRC